MKHFLLLGIVLIITSQTLAQLYTWSTPVPFSDSLSDNTGATMKYLNFYDGNDFYVFWTKSEDPSSSDIVARRYYAMDEPVYVVDEGDYHYRNPQIIPLDNFQYPDTLFILFYESDIDGDFDIYYQKYTPSGFTTPAALTINDHDDLNLEVDNSGGIIWESNGSIFFTYLHGTYAYEQIYFDTISAVDSVLCSNPSLSKQQSGAYPLYLSWEKIVNDTARIILKEFDYNTWNWMENRIISMDGMSYQPKFSEGSLSEVPASLCWDTHFSDSSVIVGYDLSEEYFMPEFKQVMPFNPHFFNVFIGVDWLWSYAVLTFEVEDQEQTDIYGGDGGLYAYLMDYVNISNSQAIDRNPYLFGGYFGTYQDVINIWESHRNGHWQLFSAQITVPVWGSAGELKDENILNLNAEPNPFHKATKLSFDIQSEGEYDLMLIDVNGRVLNYWTYNFETGHNEIKLALLESLPSGIYYVRVKKDGSQKGIKLIKN
jgi:hypothetical protein